MTENRPLLTDPAVLDALAHPVRLDVLGYLMASGPASASVCARAVGESPSNCSYHLRTLARHGLVEAVSSGDGRERPWRATITGFTVPDEADPDSLAGRGAAAVHSASLALEQRRLRAYLDHRPQVSPEWRAADQYAIYGLRVTPAELEQLAAELDALIRPLLVPNRPDAPDGAEVVHLAVYAIPDVRP